MLLVDIQAIGRNFQEGEHLFLKILFRVFWVTSTKDLKSPLFLRKEKTLSYKEGQKSFWNYHKTTTKLILKQWYFFFLLIEKFIKKKNIMKGGRVSGSEQWRTWFYFFFIFIFYFFLVKEERWVEVVWIFLENLLFVSLIN